MAMFGRFEIICELGSGGMGIVFQAHDPAMGRNVAVKVLRPDPSLSQQERDEVTRRFDSEAKSAGSLSHPNIVAHYERGEIDGHKYIVMELVEGPALHQAMSQEPKPALDRCFSILRQTAAALDYAHSRGVVHRDIKPANILLQQGEQAKVADFGIAKSALSGHTTAAAVMIGSPHYMAPEQIEGQPVSSRTDQWALAVTAYELLAGRKPFQSDSVAALFQQILSVAPPDPCQLDPRLPQTCKQALVKALNKNPEQRFGTCTEFVQALSSGVPKRNDLTLRSSHKRSWIAAASVIILLLAGLLAWTLTRQEVEAEGEVRQPSPSIRAGTIQVNRRDGSRYVWVAPGTFQMGCSVGDSDCEEDEKPHTVTVSSGFWFAQTETTAGAFRRFTLATGAAMPAAHSSNPDWANESEPIANVTWDAASAFCRWAQARLPTEAEWELAARAGNSHARYGPLDDVAWHKGNSDARLHPVGQKLPNGLGFADTLGNVWEWTADRYGRDYYAVSSAKDPVGPGEGHFRVLRGGSWLRSATEVRVSDRYPVRPDSPDHAIGFRCATDELP